MSLFIREMRINIFSHSLAQLKSRQTITSIGEDGEKQEHLYIADGEVEWESHFGKLFGAFLKSYTYTYHTTQQFHSEVST